MVRTLLVLGFMLFSSARRRSSKPLVNPLAQSMVDFQKRVGDYMKLRGEITKKVPEVKETGTQPRSAPARKRSARRSPRRERRQKPVTSSAPRCRRT